MAGISISGIGSGLDLNGLVTQLIAAEAEPATRRLDTREAALQARISAYGSLKSALSQFRSALAGLRTPGSFEARRATSSDAGAVTASASSAAAPGSFSVEVSGLAQAQKLVSDAFDSRDAVVGSGTLGFRFGTHDADAGTFEADPDAPLRTLVVDAGNNTVQGLRDAINAAALGVRASIVNDGSGERLVISAEQTGAARSVQISVSGDGDGDDTNAAGLSRLAYDPTAVAGSGRNLTQTAAARDARFSVDGLAITRASNTVTGVIEGVTLTLVGETAGAAATVSVSRDQGAAREAVNRFVNGFNALASAFADLSSFDAETGSGGVLLGDSLLRGIERNVRALASGVVDGLSAAPLRSLADIGVVTTEGGTLSIDEARLDRALRDSPGALAGLFARAGTVSDPALRFVGATEATRPGRYTVEVTQVASRGSYSADTLAAKVVDAGNDTLAVRVDGVQSGTINLTRQTYASGDALAAELQAQINADAGLAATGAGVTVSFDAGRLVITSRSFGSASRVEVTAAGASSAATLGLGATTGTRSDGRDVAGRIDGQLATGAGKILTGAGAAAGLAVEVSGGATGDRGVLTFSRGVALQLDALLTSYLDGDAALDASLDGLEARVAALDAERVSLQERLAVREARLRREFSALDGLLAQLQSTSDFLARQLGSLPGSRFGGNQN